MHAVASARSVVDEVVVCVNDESRQAMYAIHLQEHGLDDVKFVVDEKISHVSGPNVAILTGLKHLGRICV